MSGITFISVAESQKASLIGRFRIEHLITGVPHLSAHALDWYLGTSIIGEIYSFAFWALHCLCFLERGRFCSIVHGKFSWGWNLNNILRMLMLNRMVSAQISMRALALLKNGRPKMSGISRSPSASSIMKYIKMTWLRNPHRYVLELLLWLADSRICQLYLNFYWGNRWNHSIFPYIVVGIILTLATKS